jgi:hypothetical protein
VSPALQLLENLALVGGGGVVTVLAQTFADKRKSREAKREARDLIVSGELEKLRNDLTLVQRDADELRGFIAGQRSQQPKGT